MKDFQPEFDFAPPTAAPSPVASPEIPWAEEVQAGRESERRYAMMESHYQQTKALAKFVAREIKAAWINLQPCPVVMVPKNQWILEWAVRMVQCGEV